METRKNVGKRIYGVDCVIGRKTKKPNTVTMAVDDRFIRDAIEFIDEVENGNDPETGLVRIEMVAVYEDGIEQKKEVIDLEFEKIDNKLGDVVEMANNHEMFDENKAMPFDDYVKEGETVNE